ncbi:MAG: hypothetical protein ACK514_04590 [Bacteroidota bacterium]|jgi:hypothetical protein|nr:hypothetical protein [Cytophagales bacterium]
MDINVVKKKLNFLLTGQREEFTCIDSNDFTNQQFNKVVVKNSTSQSSLFLVVGLVFILLIFPREGSLMEVFKQNWIWALVLVSIPIALIYFTIKRLLDTTPKLIVDTEGIKTKDWSASWTDIVETKFRFSKATTTFLIVKTRFEEKYIDIGGTNIAPRFLGHHIELLKKQSKA